MGRSCSSYELAVVGRRCSGYEGAAVVRVCSRYEEEMWGGPVLGTRKQLWEEATLWRCRDKTQVSL